MRLSRFNPEYRFIQRLNTISMHVLIDYVRKRKDNLDIDTADLNHGNIQDSVTPGDSMISRETLSEINRSLSFMKPLY